MPAPPERPVNITGGKGIVVGDNATIFQTFGSAPAPLSSLIRVQEFQALVADRTEGFVGREFVLDAIDEILGDAGLRSAYVVLQGEPGIGKTSLLAHLVSTRGHVHHFNVAAQGIRSAQAFLSNVCAQLIVRYGLDHSALPPAATGDGGFLARLLGEAAAVAEAAGDKLVIVVDALDEADHTTITPGANLHFLPPSLPASVYFVVSTRPQSDYRLQVDTRRDIYLRDDDPANLADVRTYLEGTLEAPPGTDRESLVEELTRRSEGNFMYLVHVLRDIRTGAITLDGAEAVRRLPQGLRDYYRRHWNAMRDADPDTFRWYRQPVVCLLATAREPVSRAQVTAWTKRYWQRSGADPAMLDPFRVTDVLNVWRPFFDHDDGQGAARRYRLYHASYQDFLREEIGLSDYHETIGDEALSKIPGFLDGL